MKNNRIATSQTKRGEKKKNAVNNRRAWRCASCAFGCNVALALLRAKVLVIFFLKQEKTVENCQVVQINGMYSVRLLLACLLGLLVATLLVQLVVRVRLRSFRKQVQAQALSVAVAVAFALDIGHSRINSAPHYNYNYTRIIQ